MTYKIPMKDGKIWYGKIADDVARKEHVRKALASHTEAGLILIALYNHALEEAAKQCWLARLPSDIAEAIRALKEPVNDA